MGNGSLSILLNHQIILERGKLDFNEIGPNIEEVLRFLPTTTFQAEGCIKHK